MNLLKGKLDRRQTVVGRLDELQSTVETLNDRNNFEKMVSSIIFAFFYFFTALDFTCHRVTLSHL
jgi:hypothetical protein